MDSKKDESKEELKKINILGSGIEAVFDVHPNVAYDIKNRFGKTATFLDRGSEKGKCILFANTSLLLKEQLNEKEYEREREYEDLEMGLVGMEKEKEDRLRLNSLKRRLLELDKKERQDHGEE